MPATAGLAGPGPAVAVRLPAGQRRHPDGDAAVAGQRLAHEVEAVGHRLAAWPGRRPWAGMLAPVRPGRRCRTSCCCSRPRTGRPGRSARQRRPCRSPSRGRCGTWSTARPAAASVRGSSRPGRPARYGIRPRRGSGPGRPPPAWPGARPPRRTAPRCSLSSTDDLLGGQPGHGQRAGAGAVTVAPACASAVPRGRASAVRTVTRSPEAAASSAAMLVSAMTSPRPTITRWSAVSCSSLIRWLDTSTARPWAASDAQEAAHPDDALGVHAVERLVEHQHRRVAEHRGGDAQPLPHAQRVAARLAPGRRFQPGLAEHLVDPAGGRPWEWASQSRWLRAVRLGCSAAASSSEPAWRSGCRRRGRAGRRPARCPRRARPGRGSPASWWTCRRRSARRTR